MSLAKKLLAVMGECAHIGKDGYNSYHQYPYVTAAKMNDVINASLVKNGIVTTSKTTLSEIREVDTGSGKKERLATVSVEITLHDVDGEETMVIVGAGSGQDANDKAVAKAQTMATKYAWKSTLLIADASDDPDYDGGSSFVPTDRPGGRPVGAPTSNPASKPANGSSTKIVGKCEKCGADVDETVFAYSKKYYGEHVYCRNCQRSVPKGKQPAAAPF